MINLTNKRVKIKGDRIYLRTLDEKNATQEYCGWLNNPEVNKYLETREASIANLKQYIKGKNEVPNCLFWGIFLKNTDKHIGNIKLEPINWGKKEAIMGILIGDKNYWGKGICTEVKKLLISNSFNKLNIEKISVGVLNDNIASIICNLKAGLKIDNFSPKADKRENALYDTITMSIKKND